MVVVDVFECRARDVDQGLGHLREVVRDLHVEVPRVDVAPLQAAQRRHDVVFADAGLLEKAVRVAHHLLEHLAVLLEDGYQRAVVDARDLLHRRADLADAGAQHLVGGLGRFERQQGLFGLLFQSGRLEVAADEQPGAERREGCHGDPAAPQQQGRHGQRDEESSERRDEPPRDDGHHARDAVDGAFAAPRAVGERRSHGHHEDHVGRRQRQFVGGGDGDQDRRGGEVDHGADHVVGGRRTLLGRERLETPVDGLLNPRRNQPGPHRVHHQRRAHQTARNEGRAEAFVALVLRGERQFGLGDVLRLFREEQRQHHDQSRDAQQQEVGPGGSFERPHHHRFAARLAGDAPGVVAGQRHADEVHQVVAREGKGQREGSRQDRDAHDVEPHALENVEEERRRGPEGEERHEDVVADVGRNGGRDQSRAFQPLEQREIEDSGQRDAAPDGSPAAEDGGVAEREDEARNVHEKRSGHEGQRHRQQDRRDDDHGFARVDELREVLQGGPRVAGDAEQGGGDGGAQQTEDHRHGGRGGQSQRVVEVQQQHVAQHHAQKQHHNLLKGELSGVEDAAAGDLHHAARGERADQNAGGCDPEDHAARCDFRAEGRVEEVDGVVGDAHDDAHHGQQGQDDDDCGE